MWAVTSYYNPIGYRRRLSNYKIFRASLGIPLVAVELSFDGSFELAADDADILIQISGGAVLWQKERLLNLAISSVPSDVRNVAWVDCDGIFGRPDWVDEANRKLAEYNMVQLYSDLVDLHASDDLSPHLHTERPVSGRGIVSVVSECKSNLAVASLLSDASRSVVPGQAWAARREILKERGLYDAMIVGGGDSALVAALYGEFETVKNFCKFDDARQKHYLNWARPFHQTTQQSVGYVAGRIYHLWHGDLKNRQYVNRYERLAALNFDPAADIAVGANGAWEWARSRPDLEDFLRGYFLSRAED
jgi:hypothetical protein